MIAIRAELATVLPKVGPTSSPVTCSVRPKRDSSACSTASVRPDSSVEIWTTFLPSSGLSSVWTSALPRPAGRSASRTCSTVADCLSEAV